MKSLRLMLSVVVLTAFSAVVFAQSDAQKSDAQKSFDKLKALAGSWEGVLSGTGTELDGKTLHVTLRVTSMGNALLHEMTGLPGRPDDPITMVYLDGDRLLLTHYCDAGNRPRMTGKTSPDGKSVEFDFLDITGNMKFGHMQHALFTTIDANHHIEDWTFMIEGKEGPTPVHARFDLHRKS